MNSVVLINPPLSLQDRYGKDMKNFGAVTEPLGIAYIAGYLEEQKIPVRIIDAQAENLSHENVVKSLEEGSEQIIGISVLTPVFAAARTLSTAIKARFPDCLLILGGPHCTALPQQTLEEIPEADLICYGEGEHTMTDIVEHAEKKDWENVPGICFRKADEVILNEARPYIKDLDEIPPPARHLLPMHKYHLTASRTAGGSYCPTIIVARGCPFKCTYCSRTFGKSFRPHSIERIISEIQQLIDTYQITQINIEADTLTTNKKFLTGLCEAMIEAGYPEFLKWTCESRVDTINADMLKLMKKAGCWQISYGIETGSQRLLESISKGVTLEQVETAIRATQKEGISIRGFFMLGLPTETVEESRQTIKFAKKLNPLYAQFTITVPYPGTAMFDELDAAGKIRTHDWSKYNTWSGWKGQDEIPFVPEGREIEELIRLQKKAMRAFYLRPRVILRFLLSIRSWYDIKKYMGGAWTLVKSLFR